MADVSSSTFFEDNLSGTFFTSEPDPQDVLLSPRDRWMGLAAIFVGLLSIGVGGAFIVAFVWWRVPLTVLGVSYGAWLISYMIVSYYPYMLLVVRVTGGQVGSVGKSGLALAIVGVALTGVGCFAHMFNSEEVGKPLNILGIPIPLLTVPGLLVSVFAAFLLQYSQGFWQSVWRLLPGPFFTFVATICVHALIDYVNGIVTSSAMSALGHLLNISLTIASWVIVLVVLYNIVLFSTGGVFIVDLGRMLSFGKNGNVKHRVALTADGKTLMTSEIGNRRRPPITIYISDELISDDNDEPGPPETTNVNYELFGDNYELFGDNND
jgi:hypothetical protein